METQYYAEVIEHDNLGNSNDYHVKFYSRAKTRKGLIRAAEHAMQRKYNRKISVKFDDMMYRQADKYRHLYHLVNVGWFQK